MHAVASRFAVLAELAILCEFIETGKREARACISGYQGPELDVCNQGQDLELACLASSAHYIGVNGRVGWGGFEWIRRENELQQMDIARRRFTSLDELAKAYEFGRIRRREAHRVRTGVQGAYWGCESELACFVKLANFDEVAQLAIDRSPFRRPRSRDILPYPRTMWVSLPRSQELPPPKSTPPSGNYNPTLLESSPESSASPALSALRQESKKWQDSPEEFFAAVPDSVTKYDRNSPVDFIRGTIAFRIRAGEFFRCRKTWGYRGLSAFKAHVAGHREDYGHDSSRTCRRYHRGELSDNYRCNVSSLILTGKDNSLTMNSFRIVPQGKEHDKHREFFKQLDAAEVKQYAEEFAALEEALRDYIIKGYSCLENIRLHRTSGRPRPWGARHNHSWNTLLPDEPHQVVFDSLAKDLPLQNTDRSDPVDGQSALVDQQPPACAIAQSDERARMLYNTQISEQSPTQQSSSSYVHHPTTPHQYSESTAEMSSHPAYMVQLWPSTNTIPTAPDNIGHLPQQDFATQAVTSTPLPAHNICLAGSQRCSMGSLPTDPDRMQIHLAEQITASPHMAGYEQYQPQASLSMFGRPAHDSSHLRMNVHRQFVAEVPWGHAENLDSRDSYHPHAIIPNTTMTDLSRLHPQLQGPGFGTGSALSGVNERAMMNRTVAFAEPETRFLHGKLGGNSQEIEVASMMCTTNMASLGDIRQRIQY
ncbi:hypothetical protein BDP55DRAFT_638668 [Colletotrichum godetiae]|uniref:Uncharacterized protein n=1 Tax=Colletotrichum godetiae TaxID=1209918 RepID=A0AAJ0A7J0_9PEZI|nr:uncharacterized protein BDP55DRAFT_638668 [Colletotrichum godetiae]KAK1657494.1 hypothetical protein BDP55DRAFT_638668 [Colletotrichum godetiae]